MAHQAHNIPWRLLADNFGYRYELKQSYCQTNLFPNKKNNLEKDVRYFSKAFCQTLEEHSDIERAKYPDVFHPPEDDEDVFSEATADRIKRALQYNEGKALETCSMRALDNRKMSSWLEFMWPRRPFEGNARNYLSYDQIEVIKVLILRNEMEPVLQIIAHPSVKLDPAWERWFNVERDYGLKSLFYLPLMSYLCLNMLLQKPELYDDTAKTRHIQSPVPGTTVVPDESFLDYRLTRAYQMTVLYCTNATRQSLPHQAFFGLSHSTRERRWDFLETFSKQCGTMPFTKFKSVLGVSPEYPAHPNDVDGIIQTLKEKGLPTELCLTVIDFVDFTPSRRSLVVDDPLHHDNASELRKYLTYCWQLLIRANIVMRSRSLNIDWSNAVEWCIQRLFVAPIRGSLTINRPPWGRREWGLNLDERFDNGFCTCCYDV